MKGRVLVFRDSAIFQAFFLLSRLEKAKLFILAFLQFLIGFLDLLGVVLIGALGALSINGFSSRDPGTRVTEFLALLQIQEFTFERQVIILTITATLVLLARTVLSIYITRKTLQYFAVISAQLSSDLFRKLLHSGYKNIKINSSQELSFAVNRGMDLLVVGILGTSVSLIVDMSSLALVTGALLIIDPVVAIFSGLIFGIAGAVLFQLTHRRGNRFGIERSKLEIATNLKFLEAITTFREISIHDRQNFYSSQVGILRRRSSFAVAEMSFLPNISKFVIESLVILTSVLIGLSQFLLNDAFRAVGTITVFLAAGSRIAPAALRVQNGLLQIRMNSGQIQPTLKLIRQLRALDSASAESSPPYSPNTEFTPEIVVSNLKFKHTEGDRFELKNINLRISRGEMVALVGPSGSGKSTLAELILGILESDAGDILISNLPPYQAIKSFPMAISYLPQTISLISGSVRENICLGFDENQFSDQEVWKVLETVNLKEHLKSQEVDLDFQIGENGNLLSGGQRQRLGMARALITNPQILVLDEATSALDAETESVVSKALENLKGLVTIIVIAHRLSSVRNADKLIYMNEGEVLSTGSFEEVRAKVPDFDKQVKLLSL